MSAFAWNGKIRALELIKTSEDARKKLYTVGENWNITPE